MKKIKLFSVSANKEIEGENAELEVNFYLILNRKYLFTFLVDSRDLAVTRRNPIKAWKEWLIEILAEDVKYMRRWEKWLCRK